jgi:hypothetical protein
VLTEEQKQEMTRVFVEKTLEVFDWDKPLPAEYLEWLVEWRKKL